MILHTCSAETDRPREPDMPDPHLKMAELDLPGPVPAQIEGIA